MSSLLEVRASFIQLLRKGQITQARDLLCETSDRYETAFVAGVQEKVVDISGDETAVVTGGRNITYVTRLKDSEGNTLVTRLTPRQKIVNRAINCFLAKRPKENTDVDVLIGMACAERSLRRHMAPNQRNIIRHVLLSALYFDQFPLAGIWGPSVNAHHGRTDSRRKVLNKIVDELINCGMSMPQIREHFLSCLRFNHDKRPIDYVLKMASTKCFAVSEPGEIDEELSELLRMLFFKRFWDGIVLEPWLHSGDLCPFGFLAQAGMVTDHKRSFIRDDLTLMMSNGKIRQAYEIVDAIGEQLGLYCVRNHPQLAITRGVMACARDCTIWTMQELAPAAFSQAREGDRFGAAAALVHTFGALACAPGRPEEETSAVIKQAHEHNQPVPMELCDYYCLV